MTLDDIEGELPWGLHDADLVRLEVDWRHRQLTLDARVKMDQHQTLDQLVRIKLSGLYYFTMSPPDVSNPSGPPDAGALPWIDARPGFIRDEDAKAHPPTPEGSFVHYIYFRDDNSVLHVCARDAELTWLEKEPVSCSDEPQALFPGDEIPDPKPKGS